MLNKSQSTQQSLYALYRGTVHYQLTLCHCCDLPLLELFLKLICFPVVIWCFSSALTRRGGEKKDIKLF